MKNKPEVIFAINLIENMNDTSNPFLSCLEKLIWATEYLLGEHSYDGKGHEDLRLAANTLKAAIEKTIEKTTNDLKNITHGFCTCGDELNGITDPDNNGICDNCRTMKDEYIEHQKKIDDLKKYPIAHLAENSKMLDPDISAIVSDNFNELFDDKKE